MEKIIIPRPLQIVVDDLGWFCPTDERTTFGPARTAMTRYHVAADYEAVNYLGEQLGMMINCAFIVGEWDPDNRLRSVKGLSKYGDGWDNAAHLDSKEMARCVEVINSSPYIDFALHGLFHNYYRGDGVYHNSDYYYHDGDALVMIPEAEVRHRLDCYFDIVKYYGIKKEINSFVPPSYYARLGEMSRILSDYGILYSSTTFRSLRCEDSERPAVVAVENGIITLDRSFNQIPWNEPSTVFSRISYAEGIFGMHWPNLLHHDPARSHEIVDGAVSYCKARAHDFGTVLSRDMKYCATQSLCYRFATVTERDGEYIVDLSGVPDAPGKGDFLTVSLKSAPRSVEGGEIRLASDMGEFKNYDIYPSGSFVKIKI